MIRDLLAGGLDPRAVCYFSCDLLATHRDIADVVRSYMQWQEPFHLPMRWILLDEVSSVSRWALAIRALHGEGLLRQAVVLLTGSHALDVRRETERLPGRRGEGLGREPLDRLLLPMRFREFISALERDMAELQPSRDELLQLARGGGLGEILAEWISRSESLNRLLDRYLLCGGFPRPASALMEEGEISYEIYDLHVRAMLGDIVRWGGNERTVREVLLAVLDTMTTPVSWRTLATRTSVGSHNTVAKYVDDLHGTFTLQVVHHLDMSRGRGAPRKDRKVYVTDPFLFHALRAWCLGLQDPFAASQEFLAREYNKGKLLEAIVASHLARDSIPLGGLPSENVFHFRSGRGEVDFVVRSGDVLLALQVTASRRPRPRALSPLRPFSHAILLTGGGADLSVPRPVLPVSSFLAAWC